MSVMLSFCNCPDEVVAHALARALVDERLAACVNVVPGIRSIYRWQGQVEDSTEVQLQIKSAISVVERMTARLRELHPYELPEIISVRIDSGLQPYLTWAASECGEQIPTTPKI